MSGSERIPAFRARAAIFAAALASCVCLSPALATEEKPGDTPLPPMPDFSDEAEQMSEAARDAIAKFAAMMGPILEGIGQWVEDLPRYEAPEVLPNGDILIRRIPSEPAPATGGETDSDVTDL